MDHISVRPYPLAEEVLRLLHHHAHVRAQPVGLQRLREEPELLGARGRVHVVGPARYCSPRHEPHFEPSSLELGLADIARHVIQRSLTPRLLNYMAPYDVASNVRQADIA